MATWRNGYAEDCKSFYHSSILGVASKKNLELWCEPDKLTLNYENLIDIIDGELERGED